MLVTFESKVGRLTMFGDIAVQLIRMFGQGRGTVPSALLAEDIPEALANLKRGLKAIDETDAGTAPQEDNEDDKENKALVSLRTRAFPLIKLLEDSAKHKCDVMWDKEGSARLRF
jgi:hypothetical protein